jgi:hypothetical protein
MPAPELISPEPVPALLDTLRPPFDWNDVVGASNYTFQVSAYSNMSSPILNATVTPSEYVPTKNLTQNKTLYCRVRANGANGPSAWSQVRLIYILIF